MLNKKGQGTIEFCVVIAALIGLIYAGFDFYQFIQSGALEAHAQTSASYAITQDSAGALNDAFIH